MITKKKLQELLSGIQEGICVEPGVAKELIYLATLGLWAKDYGAKAAKDGLSWIQSDYCSHGDEKTCVACEEMTVAVNKIPKSIST